MLSFLNHNHSIDLLVALLQPRLTVVRKHSAASGALPDGSLGSSLGASLGAGAGASTAADGDLPSVMTCAPLCSMCAAWGPAIFALVLLAYVCGCDRHAFSIRGWHVCSAKHQHCHTVSPHGTTSGSAEKRHPHSCQSSCTASVARLALFPYE